MSTRICMVQDCGEPATYLTPPGIGPKGERYDAFGYCVEHAPNDARWVGLQSESLAERVGSENVDR